MASIKCGKCRGTHDSVAGVRACYAVTTHTTDQQDKATHAQREAAQERQAYIDEMNTEDQWGIQKSVRDHEAQRNIRRQAGRDAYGRAATTDHPEGVVATLRELRAMAKADMHEVFPTVHKLRVAAVLPGEGTKVRFFQIEIPTRGHWTGKVFVKEQASDDFHSVKSMDRQVRILREVLRDLRAAVELYGREIGCCGMCHRTLTDEESRARGIGPVCMDKIGA